MFHNDLLEFLYPAMVKSVALAWRILIRPRCANITDRAPLERTYSQRLVTRLRWRNPTRSLGYYSAFEKHAINGREAERERLLVVFIKVH